jgi:hypothetical protein
MSETIRQDTRTNDGTLRYSIRIDDGLVDEAKAHYEDRLKRELAIKLWDAVYNGGNTVVSIERETWRDSVGYNISLFIQYSVRMTPVKTHDIRIAKLEEMDWSQLRRSAIEEVKYRIKSKLRRLFGRTP